MVPPLAAGDLEGLPLETDAAFWCCNDCHGKPECLFSAV